MKKRTKLFALLMAVAMLLTMLPMSVWAVDGEVVKETVQEIIDDMAPSVKMSDVNSRYGLESELSGKWLSQVEKAVKAKLGVSVNLSLDIDDFEAAVPKHPEDPDGQHGSAIVIIHSKYWKGDIVHTTAHIEADEWGKPSYRPDYDDDYRDEDKYFGGKDGLGVQIVWKDNNSADRPNSVIVKVYNKDRLYRSRTIKGSKWYGEWDEVKSGKYWDVDLSTVPEGYTYNVDKVSDTYFVITLTKGGAASVNNTVSSGNKVNPSTGAF